jgi:hypothetical protein
MVQSHDSNIVVSQMVLVLDEENEENYCIMSYEYFIIQCIILQYNFVCSCLLEFEVGKVISF